MIQPVISGIATALRCQKMAGCRIRYVAVALAPELVEALAQSSDRRVARAGDKITICGLTVITAAGDGFRLIPGWNK